MDLSYTFVLPLWLLWLSGAWAVELRGLVPFGAEVGDEVLSPGSDSSAELAVSPELRFFSNSFSKIFISSNGLVSVEQLPPQAQYLGQTPPSFGMIAALMGDLDRGSVYYRLDRTPEIQTRSKDLLQKAFPDQGQDQEPEGTVVVTWHKMAATGSEGAEPEENSFQLLLILMKSSSVAAMLYPRLQYLSSPVGGVSRALEAGFSEGLVSHWWWGKSQGKQLWITNEGAESVGKLPRGSNCGVGGVWVFLIGSKKFDEIKPGTVTQLNDDIMTSALPTVTLLPRRPDLSVFTVTSEQPTPTTTNRDETDEPEYVYEDEFSQSTPITATTANTSTTTVAVTTATSKPSTTSEATTVGQHRRFAGKFGYHFTTERPDRTRFRPESRPETGPETRPETRPDTQYSAPEQPHVVVVDEDEDLDVNVFSYGPETCAQNSHRCSPFADCRDHASGFCCYCRPGYYGNGKDCVAEGKPQRMTGKLSARVFLGSALSPLEISQKDLHSYVVANDGRAYVAISAIAPPLGHALLPLSSMGGVIGWAFALEQPGHHNGFSIVGGVFSRRAEVLFSGGERLTILQQFQGIDEHEHLQVQTQLEGTLPPVPEEATVQIDPYTEVYHYDHNLITSSSRRSYALIFPSGHSQSLSYQWRQTISFQGCGHWSNSQPQAQQLTVDQIFVMYDSDNQLIRYAMSNRIGPVHSSTLEQNPCFTGRHGCDINAVCKPGEGLSFSCVCSSGFSGNGLSCNDVDECLSPGLCAPYSFCSNTIGSYRCVCNSGLKLRPDGTCAEDSVAMDHCSRGTHDCDVPERAQCSYSGGSSYSCACRHGYHGDGQRCSDIDECAHSPCHTEASCSNSQGSFSCDCKPGFTGDGLNCQPQGPTQCEAQREQALAQTGSSGGFWSFFRPRAEVFVPRCNADGQFEPAQCDQTQCWCVDREGTVVQGTQAQKTNEPPLCINQAVTPPPYGPAPPPGVVYVETGRLLLFAQSGRIDQIPLSQTESRSGLNQDQARPLLHVPDRVVIAVAFDCVEQSVYWTEITGPSISRTSLSLRERGAEPIINTDLQSPEGLALDPVSRLLFWTDSGRDTVEVSRLDGKLRRVLFDNDISNPRAIVTDPTYGRIFWTDWDREAPKIEMSNMDGSERKVLVQDDLSLPNGLSYDLETGQLCWADAGTRRVECMDPHRRQRTTVSDHAHYPFGLVSVGRSLFYTDWRREAVVGLDRSSQTETQVFTPQRKSRLYGISTTDYCPRVYNYCDGNGGCSHLCLPKLGGFSCRCPDQDRGTCQE